MKKVLLCYGSDRIKRDGLFDTVSRSLSGQGIELFECGGIVSNPVISKVREGIALVKAHQVDAMLSVGGGSVLDSVKAIAAGVRYDGDVWDLFTGKAPVGSVLPLFAILTLAATGSEMNPGAVVTNDQTQEKFFISSTALFNVGVDTGEQGIAALENGFNAIGTPTRLPQLGIKETALPTIVANVQNNVRLFGIADAYPPEIVIAILKHAL
ncbi:iron-containing alcohol dehydrogenase [Dickeya dadantii subsp. dieffenbachiae]|uniref:iron-containing alcohol dehydrogenase n=1 Tax=Dickeya dadantii TaxID=204038 RepID=UPI0022A90DB3